MVASCMCASQCLQRSHAGVVSNHRYQNHASSFASFFQAQAIRFLRLRAIGGSHGWRALFAFTRFGRGGWRLTCFARCGGAAARWMEHRGELPEHWGRRGSPRGASGHEKGRLAGLPYYQQRGQKFAARSSGRLGRLLPFAGCKRCACPSLDRHRAHLGIDRRALADRKSARASDAHPIVILCV